MSTYRIKGDDGVIIDSTKYLELPKGLDIGRPEKPRPGMIRYNESDEHRGIEASVIVETSGKRTLEWRRVAHLDDNGRLLTSQLPSSITGSLTYKGTWDPSNNDINESSNDVDPPLDPLWPAANRVGHYYIVRADGDGSGANDLAPVSGPSPKYKKGDWIVSNGVKWEKVDQSQITSTASQTSLSVSTMRDAMNIKSSASLQDALEKIVERALDRYGDTIRGTITVSSNAADPNARILLAKGSAAKPNLAFDAFKTTGLFNDATNAISFATNSLKRLELNDTSLVALVLVKGVDGDASKPAFTFASNDTAGMYKADTDVIGFSTSGEWRAKIYERGIDTRAVITAQGDASKVAYGLNGGINTGLFFPTTTTMAVSADGTPVVTFAKTITSTVVPIRAGNGDATTPSYSFSTDANTGMFMSAKGSLNFSANKLDVLQLTDSVANVKRVARFVDGTLAAPGISFISDTDTGLFRSTDNTLNIVAGGKAILTLGGAGGAVSMTGPTYITDGTVSAPGLAFSTNTDTGLHLPAAKTLALVAGGSLGLSLDVTKKATFGGVATFQLGDMASPSIIFNNQNTGLFGATNTVGVSTEGSTRLSVTTSDVTVLNRLTVPAGDSANPKVVVGAKANTGLYSPNSGEIGIVADGTVNAVFKKAVTVHEVQTQHISGSAAAPSVSFKESTNSGLYLTASKTLMAAAGGADIMQFTSAYVDARKPVKLLDGSVSAPGLCFDSSTNSGMHYAGGNVSTSIAGIDKVVVGTSGVTIKTQLYLENNTLDWASKGTIQTDVNGVMRLKATSATTPFTFGKDADVYMTITPTGVVMPWVGSSVTSGTNGAIRYNTTIKNLEGYVDGKWVELGGKITNKGDKDNPAISFGADTNTGIYSDANNTIAFSAGGVKQAQINTSNTTFYKPVIVETNTGKVTIGSVNASSFDFNCETAGITSFNFNKQVQATSFKVQGKDTALQSDGKIMENGQLLENKYLYADASKNVSMPDGMLVWAKNTDFAKIGFKDDVDGDTDAFMFFETGDNDNEYFKFRHRLSGATTAADWMNVKKSGITVTGATNTLGKWEITNTGLRCDGTNVINFDPTTKAVVVNGSASESANAAPEGYGLGETAPPLTENANTIRASGWRTYNADSGNTNGPTQYGIILDSANTNNAGTYNGWAHQIFFASNGTLYTRSNVKTVGSFNSDAWNKIYTAIDKPTLTELGAAAATHTHTPASIGAAAAAHTHTAASVGAAPTGYGLGDYAASVPGADVNTGLRTASGFYNGSSLANRPAWPMGGTHTWDYIFNAAHANPAGFNGMIAMDFNGKGLAFKTISAGTDGGWNYVYHSGYKPGAGDITAGAFNGNFSCSGSFSSTAGLSTNGVVTCGRISTTTGGGTSSFSGKVNMWAGLEVGGGMTIAGGGLNVAGDINTNGNVTAYHTTAFSDRRLKSNITKLENSLNSVLQLQGVNYTINADESGTIRCGFIAQEVQEVIPEVVIEHNDEDKTLSLDYSKLTAYLVEAMKEQQKMIEELRTEIAELKKQK